MWPYWGTAVWLLQLACLQAGEPETCLACFQLLLPWTSLTALTTWVKSTKPVIQEMWDVIREGIPAGSWRGGGHFVRY